MRALNIIEQHRPTRPSRARLALVDAAYTSAARNGYDQEGHAVAAGRTDLTGTNPGLDIVSPQMNYTFDDFGRKIKETDPLGKFWKFEYDQHNNLTKSTDAKNQITQFIYSNYGQLLSRTDHTGKKTTYSYNALGQVLTAQSPEVTYSHTYDSAHRLASVTDSRGGKKLSYAYSPGGLLNTLADNEGHRTDYLYDAVGRLTGIWAPNNDYVAFVFDAGGRLAEKWFPNGVNAQYTWNNDNTLAQVRNRFNYSDNFVVSQHDYTYNGVGQRKDAQDKLGIYAPPAMNETYAYDPLGNRTTKNDGSSPLYYVYDAANQLKEIRQTNASGTLLTAMIYDDNGNLTQKCEGGAITQTPTSCTGASVATLTYDALNQLTQVNKNGQASQYAYDDAGRRIKKTVNGNAVNYLYNGPDIQAEYQNWNQANASYTHGPNTDDPIIRVTAANDANYFHQDGLGSVVATTDLSGNLTAAQLYDAWGKPQPTASLGNLGQYGYTGREPDETGMMYYRARYYDPSIGRFISRDPIGLDGGINEYAYVGGNPVNFTDPSGLVNWRAAGKSFIDIVGSGAGVVTGGILAVAGVGLIAAPEPTMISKPVGAATLSLGLANIGNSGVGLVNSTRNFISALQDSSANLPTSGLGVLANKFFPGSQKAQDLATAGDLTLALASGRVPVGTAQINTFSALQQRASVGINGVLDARSVAVSSRMEGVLLQSADSAKSFASLSLDTTQYLQLGSLAYDKLSPPSTSGGQSLGVITLGMPKAPYGGNASYGVKPGK